MSGFFFNMQLRVTFLIYLDGLLTQLKYQKSKSTLLWVLLHEQVEQSVAHSEPPMNSVKEKRYDKDKEDKTRAISYKWSYIRTSRINLCTLWYEDVAECEQTWREAEAQVVFQVEGVEKIYVRYQTINSTTKSKTYDVLDHRKLEVTSDQLHDILYYL